ncbi:hypothetical protein GCM10023147_40980 [Tsukamurella soli]|uniref:DoxX-like family protein n=1 Tax=Tsukamurella soli TaxID=644556 RepID=A0ABP8K7M8_9ACTN
MIDTPHLPWLTAILAAVLLVDALMSLRPPGFIADCLDGVGFPREWRWILIVIKLFAVAGLVAGLHYPGIGVAADVGVVGYFVCAAAAHVRARFLRSSFWINCLGMLAFSVIVLAVSYPP